MLLATLTVQHLVSIAVRRCVGMTSSDAVQYTMRGPLSITVLGLPEEKKKMPFPGNILMGNC